MVLKISIVGNRAKVEMPLPRELLGVATQLEGMKSWLKSGGYSFEPTHYNMKTIKQAFPDAEIDDQRVASYLFETTVSDSVIQGGLLGPSGYNPTGRPSYVSRTKPYGQYQDDARAHCLAYDYAALLMEQGTGKSKVTIDVAGVRWCAGQITGMVVIAFNGVQQQWVEEAIPEHLGEMVPWRYDVYKSDGKPLPDSMFRTDKLAVLAINFESVPERPGSKNKWGGRTTIDEFIRQHRGNVLVVVDESQRIKNPDAKGSVEIRELGMYAKYRMILTGTPYAKDLTDMWAQFKFLDDSVLGHKYKTTFRSRYCKMHPKIQGVVTGSKNEEEFYQLVSPYTFRVAKEDVLDLPKKVYDKFSFELHPEQRRVYDDLKNTFRAKLMGGETVTIKNALTMVLRLQQIACGYIAVDKTDPDEDAEVVDLPWNPRLDALNQVLRSRLGKAVVWCRFSKDVEKVLEKYGDEAVSYFGGTGKDERIENKQLYINDPHITKFISNPSAGGTGVDGLQKVTRTAVYYSNSYNSIHRWQSEDRTHRIGMGGTCTYIDLIARNTVDLTILRNLSKKKSLSDLMLDDFRRIFSE